MIYYILYPGDTESDTIKSNRQLGDDTGFGVFWANEGLDILRRAVDEQHDIVNHFAIFDERGKSYTIEAFLDKISKLKVRINNG
jgi:hypothetical protein